MNALEADPKSVDLRAQSPHFYSLGARVLELFEDEAVVGVLLKTFAMRAAEIADHANNPSGALGGGEGAEFLRGLDELERELFRRAHEGGKGTRAWVTGLKGLG
jgi:GINS complex subunit 3